MRICRPLLFVVAAMTVVGFSSADAADPVERKKDIKFRKVTRTKFDPHAPQVELFKAMKEGQIATKVIANGPLGGKLLLTNSSDETVTVKFPDAFVTVHVLKQFGGGQQGGGFGGGGFGGGQQGGQQGGGQNTGGGVGGGAGGGFGGGGFGGGQQGGQQGGGAGFFSIPPETTLSLNYGSVCLNHGKPDPHPRSTYILVPVEEYTKDPVLRELIRMVGSGRMPAAAAQAAVWNRTDNMSWQQLANKYTETATGQRSAYFSRTQLMAAQQISAQATGLARERAEQEKTGKQDKTPEKPVIPNRVR